jgi:hypothetical protein
VHPKSPQVIALSGFTQSLQGISDHPSELPPRIAFAAFSSSGKKEGSCSMIAQTKGISAATTIDALLKRDFIRLAS